MARTVSAWVVGLALALAAPAWAVAQDEPSSETSRLAAWIGVKASERIARTYPTPGSWGDLTDEQAAQEIVAIEAVLAELRADFEPAALDVDDLVLFRRFETQAEQRIGELRWQDQTYLFSRTAGPHTRVPQQLSFPLITTPPPGAVIIPPPADAPQEPMSAGDTYIVRLQSADDFLDRSIAEFESRAAAGVLPPRSDFPVMIEQARNVISGAPFEPGRPSSILAAISRNIGSIADASDAEKAELLNRASAVLVEEWEPAYERVIATFERLESQAPEGEGLSFLPEGGGYYDFLVGSYTTTDLTAADASAIGHRELERIHDEMRQAMAEVGFDGSLEAFFDYLRTDDRFYYPNTDEGREAYLAEARLVIDAAMARLDDMVADPPDGPIEVVRVPPQVEAQAPSGQYAPPGVYSVGSTTPTTTASYMVALADTRAAPIYLLQPLAYHEAAPGHHLQFQLDPARRGGPPQPAFIPGAQFTAYSEGWGLYAEELAYELGLYTDPYANIGRLGMEAWRAARLVVDTGIHAEGWTQGEAVAFMLANTPLTEGQARNEVQRYVNTPGQATAYMIGKLEIEALRGRAEAALGPDFDLRAFHREVLMHGAMPLGALDETVDRWIAAAGARG